MSLQEAIAKESEIKDFIKVAPPSPEEMERKRQVDATLAAFKAKLGNITSVALNLQKQGEPLDQIKSMFKHGGSPQVKSQSDGEDYGEEAFSPTSPQEQDKKAETKPEAADTFLTEGKPGEEPAKEEGEKPDAPKDVDELVVAIPDAAEPPRRRAKVDEHGVKEDGDLLESAVDALEPGYIDLARLKPGTCIGMQSMQNERVRMGTIKAMKRTHLLCLTNEDYHRCIHEIERTRESSKLTFVMRVPLFSLISKQNVRKIIR